MQTTLRGLTLIELLVVFAIVLVLAGILTPVLARARRGAEVTSNISKMQQLGHAFSLYVEQCGDIPPSAPDLQAVANLPESVYLSRLDPVKGGLGNALCKTKLFPERYCTPFPRSFLMFSDLGGKVWALKEGVLPEPNPGWLVDGSDLQRKDMSLAEWSGTYRRLTMEGAVVTRHIVPIHGITKEGNPWHGMHAFAYLCDLSEEKIREWLHF
jgi:prepilin-type N-terminal cleavage/methylation domain-containing protein